jgi:hypothetical protein
MIRLVAVRCRCDRAKAPLERNRRTWAVSPMILAAVNGPQPTMANNDAAIRATRSVISVASSSISAVSIRRCSTRRNASRCINASSPSASRWAVSRCRRRWCGRFLSVVSIRVEFVQMPAQTGDDPGALRDEVLAVSDQQPRLAFDTVEVGHRQIARVARLGRPPGRRWGQIFP